MTGALDKELFAWLEDAKVPPVDPNNASEEEAPLSDLASLLGGDGFGVNRIAVREHSSGGWEMHTFGNPAAGETVRREAGGPRLGAGPRPGWWEA